jgi:hypothetical protein
VIDIFASGASSRNTCPADNHKHSLEVFWSTVLEARLFCLPDEHHIGLVLVQLQTHAPFVAVGALVRERPHQASAASTSGLAPARRYCCSSHLSRLLQKRRPHHPARESRASATRPSTISMVDTCKLQERHYQQLNEHATVHIEVTHIKKSIYH